MITGSLNHVLLLLLSFSLTSVFSALSPNIHGQFVSRQVTRLSAPSHHPVLLGGCTSLASPSPCCCEENTQQSRNPASRCLRPSCVSSQRAVHKQPVFRPHRPHRVWTVAKRLPSVWVSSSVGSSLKQSEGSFTLAVVGLVTFSEGLQSLQGRC